MTDVRHIELEGCFNVRDLGGYVGADGRTVRWQQLYRAGAPNGATAADASCLRALNITTVLDLRTADETNEHGTYERVCSPRAVHLLPMSDALPAEEELPEWIDPTYVGDHYLAMLAGAQSSVARALTILSDAATYPALMNCHAGKDRTGVLSAVVLGALGVDDETIMADYALSGPAMEQLLERHAQNDPGFRARMHRYSPAILSAEPAAMARFIAGVHDKYGSWTDCVDTIAGRGTADELRAALLS